MSEIESRAQVVMTDCRCDSCGNGVMRHRDGIALMSLPEKYRHECTECGYSKLFTCIYPRLEARAAE
jgi:hypothetical protein